MKTLKVHYEPVVNCGYCAGDNPECWDGTEFQTEQECEDWISQMLEEGEFTDEELGGCVYPMEISDEY